MYILFNKNMCFSSILFKNGRYTTYMCINITLKFHSGIYNN